MGCVRCGRDTNAPRFEDGSESVLDLVIFPGHAFRFYFYRTVEGAEISELDPLEVCEDCAKRLSILAWQYIEGRVVVLAPGEARRGPEPGGVM